ncbi:hypothetical protein QQZ08_005300 [Neonectria magnoliae]|uniref:Uncharacterized protein n=1 Tax=Neonectria magnoliae TaxID=2732573 RepID=A0ABR1I4S9_9HYPO
MPHGQDDVSQWFWMWDLLFRGYARPESVYLKHGIAEFAMVLRRGKEPGLTNKLIELHRQFDINLEKEASASIYMCDEELAWRRRSRRYRCHPDDSLVDNVLVDNGRDHQHSDVNHGVMPATPNLCIPAAPAIQTQIEAQNYAMPDQQPFATPSDAAISSYQQPPEDIIFAQDSLWFVPPAQYQGPLPFDFIGTQGDFNPSTFPGNEHLQNQEIIGHPDTQGPRTAWKPNEMHIDSRAPNSSFASDVLDDTQPEDSTFGPNGCPSTSKRRSQYGGGPSSSG